MGPTRVARSPSVGCSFIHSFIHSLVRSMVLSQTPFVEGVCRFGDSSFSGRRHPFAAADGAIHKPVYKSQCNGGHFWFSTIRRRADYEQVIDGLAFCFFAASFHFYGRRPQAKAGGWVFAKIRISGLFFFFAWFFSGRGSLFMGHEDEI